MAYKTEQVHIDDIRIGDVIMVNGRERTLCAKDIKSCLFVGRTILGDSYSLGYKPVIRCIIPNGKGA
jgi:hypothetical protein